MFTVHQTEIATLRTKQERKGPMNTFELLAADQDAAIRHQVERRLRVARQLGAAWHDAPRPRPRPRPVARRIRARLGEILVSTGTLIAGPAEDCAPADALGRPA